MVTRLIFAFIILTFLALVGIAQDGESRTVVRNRGAARKLLGKHKLSLQWISWDHYGSATVTNQRCKGSEIHDIIPGKCYWLRGTQKGRGNDDYLKVKGLIESIDTNQFVIKAEIETKVSHINNGKPCTRSGHFTFKITGKRKYWRLMEMDNPCDEATDYIDLYFR